MKTFNIAQDDLSTINEFPITLQCYSLMDMLPTTTGLNPDTPKTCTYGYNHNETEDGDWDEFTLNNRDQVYELIKDITTEISQVLTYRYTHEYRPGKFLNAPCDDETYDISNAIDLLHALDQIGTEL